MAGNKQSGRTQQKPFADALRIEIAERDQKDQKGLRKIANKLLNMAEKGDIRAIKELADRTDGKSHQSVQLSGDSENPLVHITRTIVDTDD